MFIFLSYCSIGSDESLLERMHSAHADNDKYRKPRTKQPVFGVVHYAGPVDYTITNFLAKNKDALDADLLQAVVSSTSPHIKRLFSAQANASASAFSTIAGTFKKQLQVRSPATIIHRNHVLSLLTTSAPW